MKIPLLSFMVSTVFLIADFLKAIRFLINQDVNCSFVEIERTSNSYIK